MGYQCMLLLSLSNFKTRPVFFFPSVFICMDVCVFACTGWFGVSYHGHSHPGVSEVRVRQAQWSQRSPGNCLIGEAFLTWVWTHTLKIIILDTSFFLSNFTFLRRVILSHISCHVCLFVLVHFSKCLGSFLSVYWLFLFPQAFCSAFFFSIICIILLNSSQFGVF